MPQAKAGVIPLEPEFIVPQDGAEKQDCENRAAKRWLATHGPRYAALDPVYLGDDLFSRQPLCQAVLDAGGHFIFVCKPSSHPLIQEYLTGADLPVLEQTVKRGKQRFVHRYRWTAFRGVSSPSRSGTFQAFRHVRVPRRNAGLACRQPNAGR
jgi:hypothetical protein